MVAYSDDVVRVLDLFADFDGSGAQGGTAPYPAFDSGESGDLPPPINIALAAPIGANGPLVFDLGDMRTLLFNSVIIQSGMRISDPVRLIFDYTQMMMAFLLFHEAPGAIEMIGLGGGSLAKYCYHHLPDSRIVVVEIDPDVIDLRRRFGIPDDDHRFSIFCADGADHVRIDRSRPDVILVDGFDGDGQVPQLCSERFYNDCYNRLNPGGLLVVNLCGDQEADYIGPMARIGRSFAENVVAVPTECGANKTVFARKTAALASSPDELRTTAGQLARYHSVPFEALAERIVGEMSAIRPE
ncbi:fused MFS/spermidine synthase [Sphingobium sp. CFD-2]|uniref:fused MFS/spermidine synthase n=1 Tax=Sphingobium sp. CFD-2 TaxID=2878542 RepID=UPI00214C57A4|nr:fused MFS/spermidine synthase [Sphingobium sp. CFD-2]